jgi:nitrate reductase alpha subunit
MMPLFQKILLTFLVLGIFAFNPGVSQAKGGDDQDQIILLNDSAAALEDSNPGLSKSLTQFADEKEKEWEYKNANKDTLPTPITDKNIHQWQERIKLLKAAALAIQPNYPLIAKSLLKMAKDINRAIEIR